MKVLFEEAPSSYKIIESRQKSNLNYTNEATFYIKFVSKLEQHETKCQISFSNNNQSWLNLSVKLRFNGKYIFFYK